MLEDLQTEIDDLEEIITKLYFLSEDLFNKKYREQMEEIVADYEAELKEVKAEYERIEAKEGMAELQELNRQFERSRL